MKDLYSILNVDKNTDIILKANMLIKDKQNNHQE